MSTSVLRRWTVRRAPDLGRALGELRRARGLTQRELAEMLGIRRDYLASLESGSNTLELQRLTLGLRRLGAELTISAEVAADAPAD